MQKFIICILMVSFAFTTAKGQVTPPIWWYGVSGAANFNFYTGTTQNLNNSLTVPTPFHKGTGVRPYASILVEYRPGPVWGGILNVGYDGLGAKFDGVEAPCNCPADLTSELSYVSIEPSLRLGFKTSSLYFFAGPSVAINVNKGFAYTQLKQPNTNADFSSVNSTIFSGQVGAGFDIPLSAPNSESKVSLSPFISYHPYFGQDPRNIESLSITTVRAGIALKFGKGHKAPVQDQPVAVAAAPVVVSDVTFTVRGPINALPVHVVSETFPVLNSVFFDDGSTAIPSRYILLTKEQAIGFKEDQLQNAQSPSGTGRSAGQLTVYHNVLNVLGDRMRANPTATVSLEGSSAQGPKDAKEFAESIKLYLVTVFEIDGSRISTHGSFKAHPSSEHPGGTKELVLLRAENRRVDIESKSPELLVEAGGGMMKPVQIITNQENPLDFDVVFNVDSAQEKVKSWSVNATDERGTVQHFGPFTGNQQGLPAATILGDSPGGDYKITMLAELNNGSTVTKETSVHLLRPDPMITNGSRYSIVFDFDKAKSIAEYDKFLTTIVAPLIVDGATVTIHGHTDIIGLETYNQKLSEERAQQTQKIIERAIANSGRDHVKFETTGFGEDANHSPFDNNLPEERFYNRTVIIDIAPVK
ncbi:OmpA family protein [Mucilaginibacter sp.]|uniref:OmpA family protein n=1 Tax=Mucilaginibacter sp. TaxID=1882438 RepID=UPI0028433643|nr:OmpA family protein [Mucilaginibacter sp.]MDR3696661.1 OmpA family protein [Mucilaginibacter sp.]